MSHSPSVALPNTGTVASVLDRQPEQGRPEDGSELPFGKMLAVPPVKDGLRKDPARKVEDVTAGAENNPIAIAALPLPLVPMVRDGACAVEFSSEGQRSSSGGGSEGNPSSSGSDEVAAKVREIVTRDPRHTREVSGHALEFKATVKPTPVIETKLTLESAGPGVTIATEPRFAEQRPPSVTLMLGLGTNPVTESRRSAARGLEAVGSTSTSAASPTSPAAVGAGPNLSQPALTSTLRETAATDSMAQALRAQVLDYELSLKTDGWESHLTSHISKMLDTGGYEAVIRVNPEHLGNIEISIAVHEGEVSVRFGAEIADTRSVLEHAVPQLRELLGTEGLQLTQMTVSASLGREVRGLPPGSSIFTGLVQTPRADRLPDARPAEAAARPSRGRRGSLDLFA